MQVVNNIFNHFKQYFIKNTFTNPKNDMIQTQGQRLRSFRETKHAELTQTQFAERIGCRQSHLSAIENDNSKLSIDLLEKLYDEFRYSPNYHIIGIGDILIDNNDNHLSLSQIKEQSEVYIIKPKEENKEAKYTKIYEENLSLHRTIERLHITIDEINTKLVKAQEKIISLLERFSPIEMNR